MAQVSHLDKPVKAGHVRSLFDYLIADPGVLTQRQLDADLLDLYFDEHTIELPDTGHSSRRRQIMPERLSTNEATRIVDLSASFFSMLPIMDVDDIGAEAKRSPKAREGTALAINTALNQYDEPIDSPWFMGAWSQVCLGRVCELVLPGAAYWYDFPKGLNEDIPFGKREDDWERRDALWRRRAPMPISWQLFDAENTFPASLSSINDEVLNWREMSWSEITQTFGASEISKSGADVPATDETRWHQPVTLLTYSNREEIAYIILASQKTGGARIMGVGVGGGYNDAILRQVAHGQGRSAIRIHPGMVGGRREYGKYWRSILFPVLSLLRQADKYASRASTASAFNTFPMLKEWINATSVTASAAGQGARAKVTRMREGDIWTLDAGDPQSGRGKEDVEPIFQAKFGDETRELLIWALERCGRISGMSDALEGQVTTNTAAWTHNWSSEQAQNKLRPLTKGVIARAIGVSEGIMRSTIAFGETLHLTRPESGHQMQLKPSDLEAFKVTVSGEYKPKVPQNWRADLSIYMEVMEKRKIVGVPSPIWASKKLAGIDDYWKQWQEGLEIDIINDPDMRQAMIKRARARFDADLNEQEGMTQQEFEETVVPRLEQLGATDLIETLRQRFIEDAPLNGSSERSGHVNAETAGLIRAESPGSTEGTGPQPQEEIRG